MTFLVNSKIVLSGLLLGGKAESADDFLARQFVTSLRRTSIVQAATSSPSAFEEVLSRKERPLISVVPWPEATVSEQDHDLVRELALHLGGVFFSNRNRTVFR